MIEERQIEILNLIKDGKHNKEIGSTLFISVNTVKVHLHKILKELGARNRAHAIYIALKKGIID